MRFFTIIAGYVAGLAVAMKYRKDKGTSKLETEGSINKTTIHSFIDEVVDIHRTAFTDLKSFARENFDTIENFDDLKKKVAEKVTVFTDELNTQFEDAKKSGFLKKDEFLKKALDFYSDYESSLEAAKTKASSFADISEETIESWIAAKRKDLKKAYTEIQSKLTDIAETVAKEDSETSPKKTTTKKPPSTKAD